MNTLTIEQKTRILGCLIEGMSVRAASRLTGAAKGTILKLIRDVGPACQAFHDRWAVGLSTKSLQLDEAWAYCYAKDRNLPPELRDQYGYGSIWTWLAIDSDSKLIVSYLVGDRSSRECGRFVLDIKRRLLMDGKIAVATDAFKSYQGVMTAAFSANEVDYAVVDTEFGEPANQRQPDTRYSPSRIKSQTRYAVIGHPDLERAHTNHVERFNLSLRMQSRRYTRLTNAASKQLSYHRDALAIYVFFYNFVRKHSTLRGKTPAMAAGITDHAFTLRDMLFAADQSEIAA